MDLPISLVLRFYAQFGETIHLDSIFGVLLTRLLRLGLPEQHRKGDQTCSAEEAL